MDPIQPIEIDHHSKNKYEWYNNSNHGKEAFKLCPSTINVNILEVCNKLISMNTDSGRDSCTKSYCFGVPVYDMMALAQEP